MADFRIEQSSLTTIQDEVYLRHIPTKSIWSASSVNELLSKESFRAHSPDLVPVFEKAQDLMADPTTVYPIDVIV